jgi:hypothetical protein
MKPAEKSLQALLLRKKHLTANSPETEMRKTHFIASEMFSQNIGGNEMNRELFGAADGNIKEIQLTMQVSLPEWFDSFLFQSFTGGVVLLLLGTLLFKLQFSEVLLQFPHFWGVIAGVLLWCFTSLEIAAVAVILLSLFSLFYRPWENSLQIPDSNG